MLKNSKNNLIMTKAVLFDFDETLQDRTKAFEKYAYKRQVLNGAPNL